MKYESEWAAIECQSRGVGLPRREGCYHVNLHHISNKRREMTAVSNEHNCYRDPVGHKCNDRPNAENRPEGKQTCDRNVESPKKLSSNKSRQSIIDMETDTCPRGGPRAVPIDLGATRFA
jgi:hypothetical protein